MDHEIRTAPRSSGLYFLDLLKKCCNGECDPTDGPSDDQMLEIFGIEISITIKQLINLISVRRRHDISTITNNNITGEKVKEYLEDNINECKICDTLIMLIETWIKKHKKEFEDSVLEQEICAADSDKWIKHQYVIELYDDGTILSQIESDLCEQSIFIFASPLLHDFKMELPRKDLRNGRTYAILESESVAKEFRDRMMALSNK